MEIIKIDDKNYQVVDVKVTSYNLDELEQELNNTIAENQRIEEENSYVNNLPDNLKERFIILPLQETTTLENLIEKLKSIK